jgi:hypothetical protein
VLSVRLDRTIGKRVFGQQQIPSGPIWHQANILRQLLKTLSQGPVRQSLLSLIYAHHISIPKYATKLGVDPQADFVNRPESQGLLGSPVLCHPSGASRVLDRHTPWGLLAIYLGREQIAPIENIHKKSARSQGGAPPRKQSGIKLGRQWLAP